MNVERVTRIVLLAVCCLSSGFVAFVLYHRETFLWSGLEVVFLVGFPGLLAFASAGMANASAAVRSGALIALFASVVSIFAAEVLVALWDGRFGGAGGVDSRSKLDRVLEERTKGRDAVPSIHPINLFASPLRIDGEAVLPMGGIGNAFTIFCNEIGKWYDYESDRFGFVNPQEAWNHQPISVAILGDSFAQGACIPDGGSFAELIRARFPATLNLGNQGDGPLLSLATLREYLTEVKPRRVLWFFFEGNDIDDLSKELRQPILARYLADPSFTQNLSARAEKVNEALRQEVERRMRGELEAGTGQQVVSWIQRAPEFIRPTLTLWHIRDRLGLVNFSNKWGEANFNSAVSKDEVTKALEHIFREARARVEGWGGELLVVYLPAQENFMRAGKLVPPYPWRPVVLDALARLEIPVIDIYPLLVAETNPLGFFPFARGGWGHYSAHGNQVVASAVIREIEQLPLR